MEDDRIRKGVPAWVVALVAIGCLFWGGVGGVVIGVMAEGGLDDFADEDVAQEDLLTVPLDAGPGDCFNGTVDPDTFRVTKLGSAADCNGPHKVEVFAVLDAPVPTTSPNAYQPDELDYFAFDACLLNFHDYVGQPYDDSDLEVSTVVPSQADWADGRRTVVCLLHHPDNTALLRPLKFSR